MRECPQFSIEHLKLQSIRRLFPNFFFAISELFFADTNFFSDSVRVSADSKRQFSSKENNRFPRLSFVISLSYSFKSLLRFSKTSSFQPSFIASIKLAEERLLRIALDIFLLKPEE